MVNRVFLVGRLGRDPEQRFTSSGTPVANFSLATDERWKDQNGERQTRTEWHQIVVWGKLAEICSQYLNKGKLVFIEGRLQTREWDDRDGNKRRTTEVVASDMRMLGSRMEEQGMSQSAPAAGSESQGPVSQESGSQQESGGQGESGSQGDVEISDDDIPF